MMKRFLFFIINLTATLTYAQTGPAGVGANTGMSELKLWLDADYGLYKDTTAQSPAVNNDRIYLWKDISGNNNHIKAKADYSRPTAESNNTFFNGLNSIRFNRNNGVQDRRNYMASDIFYKTNDITIYCVFYAVNKGGGNNVTPFKSRFFDYNFWYHGAGLVDAGHIGPLNDISMTLCDSSLAVGGGDSTTFTDYTVKTRVSLQAPHFGVVQKEAWSGIMSVSKDGETPTPYQTGKQPINNSDRYVIGATSDINSLADNTFFDGYISNVLVFNKILNEAEKIILNNYLSAKYNIPLNLHDLYVMDEPSKGNYDFEMAAIGMGVDGSSQLRAKGEGIIEVASPRDLQRGEYLFWAHNGQSLNYQWSDIPEGVKQRLERKWRVNEIGEAGKVDLTVDANSFAGANAQDLVMLIDTDNDGSFEDENLGVGLLPYSEALGGGKYLFRALNLNHENRFTFGVLKPACQTDCDDTFSPNGDGISESFYIENEGKAMIYDKYGQFIKELKAPAYWDGTKSSGEMANPGLYFIVTNGSQQKTVTLIR